MNKTGFEDAPQYYYDEDIGKTLTIVPTDDYVVKHKETVRQQRDYLVRKEAIERGGIRNYVTAYHGPVRKLNDILNLNELGAIMKLLPYMRFDRNGALMDGSKRMGVDDIAKVIGKTKRWTIEILASLVRAGVLISEKDGRRNVYNVSETYHTIGRVLEGTPYTKIYQTKTRADIAHISIQAAGVLYKMIPFIHYERLYLCANPNERDFESIRHLSQARFAAEINVDDGTASRCMRELIRHGFVMRSEVFGSTVIMMNPDVMFRKKTDYDEYTEWVRYQFRQGYAASSDDVETGVHVDISTLPF